MVTERDAADPLQQATQRALGGDVEGAVADLRKILASAPDDEEACLALGMVLSAAGRWSEAAEPLGRAVASDGSVLSSRLAYARSLEKSGKLDDAAFHLLKAEKLAPGDPRPLRELGAVFYRKGLYDKAVQFLGRARGADPNDARTWYALGLAQEARRDPGAAIAAYREAIRLDPTFGDPKKTLADLLAGMGEHEQAIFVLDDLLRIERTNEQAAQNREVLVNALEHLREHRLLGKTEQELERSAIVQEGQLKRKGRLPPPEGASSVSEVVRYASKACEMLVGTREDRTIASLFFALSNPDQAMKKRDNVFQVTVVGESGRRQPADFATAATLTFLREALGAPMTQASTLYARLLASGEVGLSWNGMRLRFASVPGPETSQAMHGLLVEAG